MTETEGGELPRKSLSVGVVLTDGFAALPVTGFLDALRAGTRVGREKLRLPCTWSVMTADGRAVGSTTGIRMTPDGGLSDPSRFDYLLTVGGVYPEKPIDGRIIHEYLSRAAVLKVPIIGVCGGVFTLARAGLLSGRKACVSWFHYRDFVTEFPSVTATTRLQFLVDGDRITCAGGTAAIHLAAHLVEQHFGRRRAMQCMRLMLETDRRSFTTPQPASYRFPLTYRNSSTLHPTVRRTLLIMEERLDQPLNSRRIAEDLGISLRTLQRYFLRTLGVTPREAFISLRLHAICESMKSSEAPLSEIAAEFGFPDSSHLSHSFRRSFGETPTQVRDRLQEAQST